MGLEGGTTMEWEPAMAWVADMGWEWDTVEWVTDTEWNGREKAVHADPAGCEGGYSTGRR